MLGAREIDYWNADEMMCRFIKACTKENVGWLALAVCISGYIDAPTALNVFCGIKASDTTKGHKGTRRLNIIRLKEIMKERNLTNTDIAKLTGVTKYNVANMFYRFDGDKYVNKVSKFVDNIEKGLGMPTGSMSE